MTMRVWLPVALIIMLALFRGYGAGLPQVLWTVESSAHHKRTSPQRPVSGIFDSSLCRHVHPTDTQDPAGGTGIGSLHRQAYVAMFESPAGIPSTSTAVDPACRQKMDSVNWWSGGNVERSKAKTPHKNPTGRPSPPDWERVFRNQEFCNSL